MRPTAVRPLRPRQAGVTLIEILVAMVLLAIGLLGIAGLQLRGMQVNQGSASRSQAAIMAEDLADRIRAEVNAANPANATASFTGDFTAANAATTGHPQALQDWLGTLNAILPSGTLTTPVSCGTQLPCVHITPLAGATAPTPVEIDVFWNDARDAAAAAQGQSATTVQAASTAASAPTVGAYRLIADVSAY